MSATDSATTTAESTARPDSPLAASTVCGAFRTIVAQQPDGIALRTQGDATVVTWREYSEQVERLAVGLAGLGLRRGQTLAIQLTNRPEFHFVDMAAVHLGAAPFSVYNTSSPEQIRHRLENAESRIYVTELAFLDTAREAAKLYGGIEHIVVVNGRAEGTLSLEDVGASADGLDFEQTWRSVSPEDVVTLIYTSGTTGQPKAAQLTHKGVMGTLRSLDQVIPLPRRAMVSFLPMAHVAERMWTHYMPLAYGATSTCCPDREQVFACMREARPDSPFMVPRLFEKVRGALLARIAAMDAEQRAAFERGIAVGMQRVRIEQEGGTPDRDVVAEHEKAKDLFRRTLLEGLGLDKVTIAFMGGAPCPRELVEFFNAIGIPVREGYGLTEVTGFAGVFPTLEDFRIGTVGRAVPGVELRLAEDGEILMRSEMMMLGYRKEPEKTREAIDEDGWLHTGDIGELDADGYLKIIDRKKDLIINSYGKNMSPVLIEEAVRGETPLIGTVVAVGDGRPYNVALVALEGQAAAAFAESRGLTGRSTEELSQDEAVLAEIQSAVERANERLSRTEQIRAFRLLPTEWMPDSDELTPTSKLKRRPIAQKYASEIEALYAEA